MCDVQKNISKTISKVRFVFVSKISKWMLAIFCFVFIIYIYFGSKQFLCVLHFFCEQFILVSYVLWTIDFCHGCVHWKETELGNEQFVCRKETWTRCKCLSIFVNKCVELFNAISVSYVFVTCLHMKRMNMMYVRMSICFRQICQFVWCDFYLWCLPLFFLNLAKSKQMRNANGTLMSHFLIHIFFPYFHPKIWHWFPSGVTIAENLRWKGKCKPNSSP